MATTPVPAKTMPPKSASPPLTHEELVAKATTKLMATWEMHRGQLPQDLIDALAGLRDAVAGKP